MKIAKPIDYDYPLTRWYNRLIKAYPALDLEPIEFEEDLSACCGAEITETGFCRDCWEHAK